MLECVVIHGTLQQEGLVTDNDKVIEFLPEVVWYDAWHREWGSGYAVETSDEDGNKYRCWLSTIRERNELIEMLADRVDFPFYVLSESNNIYAVRSGFGMYPHPLFELDPDEVFVKMTEIGRFPEEP